MSLRTKFWLNNLVAFGLLVMAAADAAYGNYGWLGCDAFGFGVLVYSGYVYRRLIKND